MDLIKILAINSSYSGDKGYTKFLIDKLFQGATDAGAKCEVITLAKLRISRCKACQRCHTDEHHLKCIFDDTDDVKDIFDKMREADIIIFATPVYIFNMSALLKIFLERLNATGDSNELRITKSGLLFHHVDHEICSKPFVTLVCCDNMEDETSRAILSYFRTYSRFMDAKQVGVLVRRSGKLVGYHKDPDKEKKFPKIQEVYNAYYQAGRELATNGKINYSTQKRANQNILNIPLTIRIFMRLSFFKRRIIERAQTELSSPDAQQ